MSVQISAAGYQQLEGFLTRVLDWIQPQAALRCPICDGCQCARATDGPDCSRMLTMMDTMLPESDSVLIERVTDTTARNDAQKMTCAWAQNMEGGSGAELQC